eukprot:CAMPEP_0172203102 /NCGR_PEP_ID=MMETSP1050-20130122/31069_1 /TAXON_ID=233186 /ORGANISM="Cryptomonas curvata, Strain CCAP979/52" /LENGTH=53 /DNA_ID=CAMNT_0012881223 /DNA_START=40 /DNA_END=198 /DNA_ORIENTATION=+
MNTLLQSKHAIAAAAATPAAAPCRRSRSRPAARPIGSAHPSDPPTRAGPRDAF